MDTDRRAVVDLIARPGTIYLCTSYRLYSSSPSSVGERTDSNELGLDHTERPWIDRRARNASRSLVEKANKTIAV